MNLGELLWGKKAVCLRPEQMTYMSSHQRAKAARGPSRVVSAYDSSCSSLPPTHTGPLPPLSAATLSGTPSAA